MALRLITPPTEKPVTAAQCKTHLNIPHSDWDASIEIYIGAAVNYLDGYGGNLGRCMITQTWELVLDEFPSEALRLPIGPIQTVTSVKYDDTNGDEQTFNALNYTLDAASDPAWLVLDSDVSWPEIIDAINAVRVRFVAGYGAAEAVPDALKLAIMQMVGTSVLQKEGVRVGAGEQAIIVPGTADWLTSQYRVLSV